MLKDLAKIAGAAAAVFVVYWIGAWMYWHFTLIGAMNSMDRDIRVAPIPEHGRAYQFTDPNGIDTIKEAGCRALPYLVDNMSNKRTLAFLTAASDLILQLSDRPIPEHGHLGVTLEDTPEVRDEKLNSIKLWYRAEGKRFHQWWRVWSSDCPVAPPRVLTAP